MHISQHAHQRMNQRGISRRLVDFTLRHGRVEGNKHVLDRCESRRVINELMEELRCAKRILDKGGMTVVEGGDVLITAYNVNVPPRGRVGRHGGGGAAAGQPIAGDASSGYSNVGHAGAGHPSSGYSNAGHASVGYPSAGHASVSRPSAGHGSADHA